MSIAAAYDYTDLMRVRVQTMKALTIRNVSSKLADALEKEKSRLEMSMNSTILHLLNEALGLNQSPSRRTNGLEKLAGGWSEEEFEEFERNTAGFRRIDNELWE